ncbi:UDP binding domain-containing protein [Dyella sp.]|uniref:UDP binding domain-containing protein n=1 Tax=Dyella sp. TaxID=1869338 RepID=UPI002FDAAE2F
MLGLTFKQNCADLRNTRVVDLVRELESFGPPVDAHDPWADAAEAHRHYGVRLLPEVDETGIYAAVVLAVAHQQFKAGGAYDGAR